MCESKNSCSRAGFNPKLKIGLRGSATSDGGLAVIREPDERLGLTGMAGEYLKDKRHGKNIQQEMEGLPGQSLYSRLGGYEDTNDAEGLRKAMGKTAAITKAFIIMLLFLCGGLPASSAGAENLINNPLFEETDAEGNPAGWAVPARWPGWVGDISLTSHAFKGSRALMVELSGDDRHRRIEQRMRGIEQSGEYRFRFYTRISGEAQVSAFWFFLGEGGRVINVEERRRLDRPLRHAPGWTMVSRNIEVPEGTVQIGVLLDCWLLEHGDEGVVFFDDVSLVYLGDRKIGADVLPEGAELVLHEDFSGGVIPAGWEIADRGWTVENGALRGEQYGKIYYTAGVGSPNMRVEYTAWTDGQPGDLSAALAVREPGPWPGVECYYFGFGARLNTINTIMRRMRGSQVLAEQGGVFEVFEEGIRPGVRHRVAAQRNYNELRLFVDGELVLEGNDPFFAGMDGEMFGFILDNPGFITDVTVYKLPWEAGAAAAEREIEFKLHEGFEGYPEGEGPGGFTVRAGSPVLSIADRPTWVYKEPAGTGTEFVKDHCLEIISREGATIARPFEPLGSGIVEFDVLAESHGELRFALMSPGGEEILNLIITEDGRFMSEDGNGRRILRDTIRYQRRRFDADFRFMKNRWYTFRLQFSEGLKQIVLINHYSEIKGGFPLGIAGEYLPLSYEYADFSSGENEAASFVISCGGGSELYFDNLIVFGPVGTDTVGGKPLTMSAGELLDINFPARKDPVQLKTYSYRNVTDSPYRVVSLDSFRRRHRAPGHEDFREAGSVYNKLLVGLAFLEERINLLDRSVLYESYGVASAGPAGEALAELGDLYAEAESLQEEALILYARAYLSDTDVSMLDEFYPAAGRINELHETMDAMINSALSAMAGRAEPGDAPRQVPAPSEEGEISWNPAARRWERNGEPAALPFLRRVLYPYWFESFKMLGYPKYKTEYYNLRSNNAAEGEYIEKTDGRGYSWFKGWAEQDRTGKIDVSTGIHYATMTAPDWWYEKHRDKDIIFVQNDGTPFDSPYGSRDQYMLNYWHPEVRNLIAEQFAEIGKLAREHEEQVDFIRISAEVKNTLPGRNCPGYNPTAVSGFQDGLRQKYGTIEALNGLWDADYESFEAIQPPREGAGPSGLYYEFNRFRHEGFNDWLAAKTRALNEHAPSVPVTADMQNTFGGALWSIGIDPVGFSRAANIRWYHTYQGWDRKFVDRWNHQLGAALGVPWGTNEWGVAQGSPYMFKLEEIRNNGLREKFMQMMWGASMFDLYGNLHGNFQYAPGLQDYRMDYVVFTYKAPYHALFIDRINRLGREALTIPAAKPEIGILETTSSYYNGLLVREAMRPIAVELAETGWNFEFIYEQLLKEELQSLEGTRVLFVPQGICMSEELFDTVYEWVRNGGIMISTGGPAGALTRYGRPSGRLHGVFGAPWEREDGRWMLEGMRPFYESGAGKAWKTDYGAGKAVVFDNITDHMFEVMSEYAEKSFGSGNPAIQFCMREKDGVKYLYALNWCVYETQDADIFLKGSYGSIVDEGLQAPMRVPHYEENGKTYFRTRLAPGGGTLFRIE